MTAGPPSLQWLGHASFLVRHKRSIYFDPWNLPGTELPKADIILITHDHRDHCSPRDVKKIAKPSTIVVGPRGTLSKFMLNHVPMGLNEKKSVLEYTVETVHAYDPRGDENAAHGARRNFMGYVLELDGLRLYHSGDTARVPDRADFKIDVALLPVCGGDLMGPAEAVQAVKTLKPKLAVPMHYGSLGGTRKDAEEFGRLCRKAGFQSKVPALGEEFRLDLDPAPLPDKPARGGLAIGLLKRLLSLGGR